MIGPLVVDRSGLDWCLFLDRDGVINRRLPDDYVRRWEQFEFLPEATTALGVLTNWAPHTVIVTNQQGVGKGLMSRAALDDIHSRLVEEIQMAGGRVDQVLACVHLASDHCACRKPQAGLAVQWLAEHPSLAGEKSVMVGDTASDVRMARNLAGVTGGCTAVLVGDAESDPPSDLRVGSLAELASLVAHEERGGR